MGHVCSKIDAVNLASSQEENHLPKDIEDAFEAARQMLASGKSREIKKEYVFGQTVGHGAFAKVVIVTRKADGKQYAAKVVSKKSNEKQLNDFMKEIAIMTMLQEHPNVCKVYESFEDQDNYYLIMELCSGGELFEAIISKGHFSEKEAGELMNNLLDFLGFCHSKHIIHRDLKPENILLSSKDKNAVIKVIDFGTSDFILNGKNLSEKFGTPYYVAPEVLVRDYHQSADVWSLGVIMYVLLCGYPPFGGKTDEQILRRVARGEYSFKGPEWSLVSQEAKDLISAMLVMDKDTRSPPNKLLNHAWFNVAKQQAGSPLGNEMIRRLQSYSKMMRLKRLALTIIARTLTDRDVKRLREIFEKLDTNMTGKVSKENLFAGLEQIGAAIDQDQMNQMIKIADQEGTGEIDYSEFIAAMIDCKRVARRKDAVRTSFEVLDADSDGIISAADITRASRGRLTLGLAQEILKEAGAGEENQIDFERFQQLMAH